MHRGVPAHKFYGHPVDRVKRQGDVGVYIGSFCTRAPLHLAVINRSLKACVIPPAGKDKRFWAWRWRRWRWVETRKTERALLLLLLLLYGRRCRRLGARVCERKSIPRLCASVLRVCMCYVCVCVPVPADSMSVRQIIAMCWRIFVCVCVCVCISRMKNVFPVWENGRRIHDDYTRSTEWSWSIQLTTVKFRVIYGIFYTYTKL